MDYTRRMRQVLENTDHLTLRQAEISELMVENHEIRGVKNIFRRGIFLQGCGALYRDIP